jgi:hypothetical protein
MNDDGYNFDTVSSIIFAGLFSLAGLGVLGSQSAYFKNIEKEIDQQDRQKLQLTIQKVAGNLSENPRMQELLSTGSGFLAVEQLSKENMTIEFSPKLANTGAIVAVQKNRVLLNPFETASAQREALFKIGSQIETQMQDGLPYGEGESYDSNFKPLGLIHPDVKENKADPEQQISKVAGSLSKNPRMKEILRWDGDTPARLLSEYNMTVEFSPNLADTGAIVAVQKHRVLLNPFETASAQREALFEMGKHIETQAQNGQSYGEGESYDSHFKPLGLIHP